MAHSYGRLPITTIDGDGSPEPLYAALSNRLSEQQIVDLTLIVTHMNAWNRLAISFGHRPEPGNG